MYGCDMPRDASRQALVGETVPLLDEARAGDLLFFDNQDGQIIHVGIYAGNGQFIHAPNSRSSVSYSDLTSGYWAEHYYGARRIG